MAFKSNTVQSLVKKTLNTLDPYPRPCQKESSDSIYNPSIQPLPSLYAPLDTQNNYPFNPLIQKRWSTNSLDNEIKKLLHEKLVRQVVKGRPSENLQFHRKKLIKQIIDWIGGNEKIKIDDDDNDNIRHELITLLATTCKQNVKDIPLEDSEWTKLLNQWIKANTSGAVLSNREIYKILAVDGFRGFKPKDLKSYLSDFLLPLRKEYKLHYQGIRKMYDFFNKNESISSLTGTDSACVVFLALLEWYINKMKDNFLLDDQIMFRVQQTKLWAEGFLQQHVEYYKDIKNVDERFLQELGKIYAEQFKDESWVIVGRDLLSSI